MTLQEIDAYYQAHIAPFVPPNTPDPDAIAAQIYTLTGTSVTGGVVADFNRAVRGLDVRDNITYLSMLIRAYNDIVYSEAIDVPADASARIAALEAMGVGYDVTASGSQSHAEGHTTFATVSYAHAEGRETRAEGVCAHAEGYQTSATEPYSHTEGFSTDASEVASHAEGYNTEASGPHSHAEGTDTKAVGDSAHAEGVSTEARGDYSHTEGHSTIAFNDYSHAEGYGSEAHGPYSHAEGHNTTATNEDSHAEGYNTEATGIHSHAEGMGTKAVNPNSHAEGASTEARGSDSHAEGLGTRTDAVTAQHVQGKYNASDATAAFIIGNGTADNNRSNAATIDWNGNAKFIGADQSGGNVTATGKVYSENNKELAKKEYVDTKINPIEAMGVAYSPTVAEGSNGHAEGFLTTASGNYGSHAEGRSTTASGEASHAEGYNTEASNMYAHAEGMGTHATGADSHAEGASTEANGHASHAEGLGTKTSSSVNAQHVQGRYNAIDDTAAFIIGNGEIKEGATTRSNAATIDWDGNARFAGNVYSDGNKLATESYVNGKTGNASTSNKGVVKIGNGIDADTNGVISLSGFKYEETTDASGVHGKLTTKNGVDVSEINVNKVSAVEIEALDLSVIRHLYVNDDPIKIVIRSGVPVELPYATQEFAQKLYMTGSDNKLYGGVLKCVNGKPVFEYDEVS